MKPIFNLRRLSLAGAVLCATFGAPFAMASAVISVNVNDGFYGNYSGSVGNSGDPFTLTWNSAGYFWGGNIGLTDALGNIVADITTNFDDVYVLHAEGSGFASLGTACVADSNTGCVALSGSPQSLYSTVNSLNGGQGIYPGDSDIIVTGTLMTVPEPGSMLLVGTSIVGMLALNRRRRAIPTVKT